MNGSRAYPNESDHGDRGTSASEDTGLRGGGLWDLKSVGERNEALFIRVWKPFPTLGLGRLNSAPSYFGGSVMELQS